MPKQLTRTRAATVVTLQAPLDQVHCRQLDQLMHDAGDKARLRVARHQDALQLQALPERDPLVRRLFSRPDIAMERMTVRAALAQAAVNVTPERLRALGSPGRLAVASIQEAANTGLRTDVRAGQLRHAAALLAGSRRKRSFTGSPLKSRSSWLAQTGANNLPAGDGARRVQLRRFCIDSVATGNLSTLLAVTGDKPESIAGCIAIFRAAALGFILEDMKGGRSTPEALAAQVRKSADSPLLRLFIARWLRAKAAGRIDKNTFLWFGAVDWLAGALHGARPTSPGATRAPRSPRVASPGAAARRRAQAATPAPAPIVQHDRVPTPARHAVVRRRATVVRAAPRPKTLQVGRQGASRSLDGHPMSPTRLVDMPARQAKTRRKVARAADVVQSGPAFRAAPAPSTSIAAPPSVEVVRAATLLDIVLQEYAANVARSSSGSSETGSVTLPEDCY